MLHLPIGESRNVDKIGLFSPEQPIRADFKEIGDFYKHFDGRKHVVVFPVGNALFGNAEKFGKFNLIKSACGPKFTYVFV